MTGDETNPVDGGGRLRQWPAIPALLGMTCILLILAVISLPLEGARAWICRSPLVYVTFRFVLAWLAGLPVLAWLRRGKANGWLKLYAALLIMTLIVSPMLLIFHLIFGFGPALKYNPLGTILPFGAALGMLIHAANNTLRERGLSRWNVLPIPLSMAIGLLIIGWAALALPPNTYPEYTAYLSRKYGREITLRDQHLLERSVARPVADAPPPPPGLAVKYLLFGERAIDASALLD